MANNIFGNIASSAKPEVHNAPQRRQRRSEPRPQATCTEISRKWTRWASGSGVQKTWRCSDVWWFLRYACGQTDRQTRSSQHSVSLSKLKDSSSLGTYPPPPAVLLRRGMLSVPYSRGVGSYTTLQQRDCCGSVTPCPPPVPRGAS